LIYNFTAFGMSTQRTISTRSHYSSYSHYSKNALVEVRVDL
jgi:hypothetical protein